ncbi:MAG TPA: KGG domain-containing protein [Polyangiaceae bacterium]|nr:KGG domain-containing protein [Polyangiaceae bacterium]
MEKAKSRRGFASMDPELQRTIAHKGGKAAHAMGKAHEFTSEEAKEAGRRGGLAVSSRPGHMAAIGRIGGTNRGRRKREAHADAPATTDG